MKQLLMLNSFALSVRADGTYAPFSGEAWAFAGKMTLLGMCMVFAVLALLWGVLAIFKLVFSGKTPKAPKEQKKEAPAKPAASEIAKPTAQASGCDGDLIAVLTAAVAAYRNEEGACGEFRVVSFKRSGSVRAWNTKR